MASEHLKLFQSPSKRMHLEPEEFHPRKAAEAISQGKAFYVSLEPGDMTRYDFYIIPCLGQLYPNNYGIGTGHWVYLGPVNLARRDQADNFVHLSTQPEKMFHSLSTVYVNEWTAQVVSYYLALMFREIGKIT